MLTTALALCAAALLSVVPVTMAATTTGVLCDATSDDTFVFRVDPFAGLMGQYTVDGCVGTSPTLAIMRGTEYTLVQKDVSNWMHPLGLAYYPDGAHGFGDKAEVPELEEPIPSDCDKPEFACNPGAGVRQAPLYGIDGVYETLDDWNSGPNSGLDVYEAIFQRPEDQWAEAGGEEGFGVKFTIPANSKTGELFYLCHVHQGMSGRIIVTDAAADANALVGWPVLDKAYYGNEPTEFDDMCGTSGVGKYHTDADKYCPGQEFLCSRTNTDFSNCMQAIDCAMNYNMRVQEHSTNRLAVFMQQMIPHHENAVMMSRVTEKLATDSVGYDDEEFDVPGLLRAIVATQNQQIQTMEAWLQKYAGQDTVICTPPVISA